MSANSGTRQRARSPDPNSRESDSVDNRKPQAHEPPLDYSAQNPLPAAHAADEPSPGVRSEAPTFADQSQPRNGDDAAPPPPPQASITSFHPLFTHLNILQGSTETTYHPTVHYIFSDDDPELLTSAALMALERGERGECHPETSHPAPGEVEERVILIDLSPSDTSSGTGYEVTAAKSLSGNVGVVGAEVLAAPSWEGGRLGKGDGVEKGMLRISGRESSEGQCLDGGEGEGEVWPEVRGTEGELRLGLDELVARFERGMGVLDDVMGWEGESDGGVSGIGERAADALHLRGIGSGRCAGK